MGASQRGFLGFSLVQLIMYGVMAAAVIGLIWGVINFLEGRGYDKGVAEWKPQYEAEKTAYKGFRDEQARLAKTAEEAAARKNEENYEILTKQTRVVAKLTNRAIYAERLLRERAPIRPDGSEVSRSTCDSGGVAGTTGEFIPIAEYRALELRAFKDTDRCNTLQEAVKDLAGKGLVMIEKAK